MSDTSEKPVRHILSLSGGKDSSALAIYMKDRIPEMEYVFCDTSQELQESYDYLDKLEAYLGKPIIRLKQSEDAFNNLLQARRNFLPSPQMRWCTELLKIRPFEQYVGDDPVISYVGIRADENRKGYITSKPNLIAKYPFIEDGLVKADIEEILESSGMGFPEYYKWRSRSGCYFCFFQQRIEWVGLLENHKDLFEKAKSFEKEDPVTGRRYTWVQRESLEELSRPERIAEIKAEHKQRLIDLELRRKNLSLSEVLADDNGDERACLICEL